jgi:transposase
LKRRKEERFRSARALTVSLLDGSLQLDAFVHRKAVGSYTGCCPSEQSSGGIQRFGAIDRHGNKHVRVLMVEAVWRLLRWQPHWHARQKYLSRPKHGASLKKKVAVALHDISHRSVRWRSGQATRRTGLD